MESRILRSILIPIFQKCAEWGEKAALEAPNMFRAGGIHPCNSCRRSKAGYSSALFRGIYHLHPPQNRHHPCHHTRCLVATRAVPRTEKQHWGIWHRTQVVVADIMLPEEMRDAAGENVAKGNAPALKVESEG